MEFSFFTTDNKSGYKTTEKWLSKNHPDIYNKIIDYSKLINFELGFKEKIWFYYNNLKERPKCLTCGNEIKFRNRFDKPYGEFCSLNCINTNTEEMVKRQKETFNQKYGIDFYPQHKDFIGKQQMTKLNRYGDKNYNNMRKNKSTKLLNHGDENYVNNEQYKETCNKKYGVDNFAKTKEFKEIMLNNLKKIHPDKNIINVQGNNITIFCEKCNDESTIYKQLFYSRIKHEIGVCTKCNKIGQGNISQKEQQINDFINSLNVETIQSYKTKNKKMEIDILIPKHNIGIELNGLYWHNELFKESNFHLNKTNEANSENIELLHIFEDEWVYRRDIVKSIIKNRLGVIENKIYARKCVIKEVINKEANLFLDRNHIQGSSKSSIRIGLYHQDELVSLMTFSHGRIVIGGKKDEWELVRFANKINTNVIGAASRLLNFFLKTNKPEKIISYSDIRLFNGGLYEKIGFKKVSQSIPNYWYIIQDNRFHRFNFRKDVLVKDGYDANKTEREIMLERGIYRIYDCGAIRWEFNSLQTPT